MTTLSQNARNQVSPRDAIPPFDRRSSTESSATTLVDTHFAAPSRSSTGSTTASTVTYASTHTVSSNSSYHVQRRGRSVTPTPTIQPRRSVENKANRNANMSPVQAQLLRNKGTYTDSGRHSGDWLFGGFSFTKTAKGAWRKVSGGNNSG